MRRNGEKHELNQLAQACHGRKHGTGVELLVTSSLPSRQARVLHVSQASINPSLRIYGAAWILYPQYFLSRGLEAMREA